MRFVEEEGEDAGVEAVSDQDFASSKQGYRALEHVLVAKLPFINHLWVENVNEESLMFCVKLQLKFSFKNKNKDAI